MMALSRFLTDHWQVPQGKIGGPAGRGPAGRGPGFGWTSPDRKIKSQSQRCERIDLNLGGSLIFGFVIRSAYFDPNNPNPNKLARARAQLSR